MEGPWRKRLIMFSEGFLYVLLVGSLVWTGLGALVLVVLLLVDFLKKAIW